MTGARAKAPWHLWVVSALALAWNGLGALDYAMSLLQGETYYRASGMTPGLIDYYTSMPLWVYLPWTLGIGGALAGTVLLFLRSRFAAPAFWLSLLGSVISNLAAVFLSHGAFLEAGMPVVPVVILVVCLGLALYSTRMSRAGSLR